MKTILVLREALYGFSSDTFDFVYDAVLADEEGRILREFVGARFAYFWLSWWYADRAVVRYGHSYAALDRFHEDLRDKKIRPGVWREKEGIVRHRWIKIDEDIRRSVLEPRPRLHRCARCGVYRASFEASGAWRTVYGRAPYQPGWTRECPQCEEVRHET